MIEIVFGDSACGSLKIAQFYGRGKFSNNSIAFFAISDDGGELNEEEIKAARQEAEEKERFEWENATPMGGNPADVYGFDYHLSIGDISENVPGQKRQQVLEWLYSLYSFKIPTFTTEMMQVGMHVLEEIHSRILAKESVRIWYSNHPDELCGMYWFMAQLNPLDLQSGRVVLVQLPDWEMDDAGNMVMQSSWGSVKPGDWHRHLGLQKAVTPSFCETCAAHWHTLQKENATLRAMLNGRLVSVPETIYDEIIVREIEAEADEFHEASLIGSIMEKYKLRIRDTWIVHRIESMICNGSLVPVTEPAHGNPIYDRKLRKCVK